MDISDSLAPASDQLDAIELVGGPRTFRIARVTKGSDEQPVNVHFEDFPRPWRPSKGMRRVLAACWGTDASAWTGRSVTLFYDETVTFGKERPGGTRISHLSHIDGPKRIPLLVKRGKSATFTVQPLADHAPSGMDEFTDAGHRPMTADQLKRLQAAFPSPGAACEYLTGVLGREVTDPRTLSTDEARTALDSIGRDEPLFEGSEGA